MEYFMAPEMLSSAIEKTKNSYVTHIWNTQLNQRYDIKNKPPIKGSFIDYLFGDQ